MQRENGMGERGPTQEEGRAKRRGERRKRAAGAPGVVRLAHKVTRRGERPNAPPGSAPRRRRGKERRRGETQNSGYSEFMPRVCSQPIPKNSSKHTPLPLTKYYPKNGHRIFPKIVPTKRYKNEFKNKSALKSNTPRAMNICGNT